MTPTGHFIGFLARTSPFVLAIAIAVLLPLSVQAEELEGESRVMGYQQCIECHELPAEAWMRSGHAHRSLAMLSSNSRSLRYADRLNIPPSELAHDSVCTNCHGTRQQTDAGTLQVVHGVSCESCHGPAGESLGSSGWLELHSGEEQLTGQLDEERKVALREAGMAGVSDLYSLAVRCYRCHSVSNEQVVGAGHTAGTSGFELTTWFSGEVRHNFAPYTIEVEDDEVNKLASTIWLAKHEERSPTARKSLMFVIGQLADLEVNLRNRAQATEEGTFATSAASRSVAALARLEQITQRVEISELLEVTSALEAVRPLLFLPPEESHKPVITEAADRVSRSARAFIAKHDGRQLAAIEPLLSQESKGQAFQP